MFHDFSQYLPARLLKKKKCYTGIMISCVRQGVVLTLSVPCISEICIEIKIKLNHACLGASGGFLKALKAFLKPFEAPQISAKIKI